jgi:hypothetical protein
MGARRQQVLTTVHALGEFRDTYGALSSA